MTAGAMALTFAAGVVVGFAIGLVRSGGLFRLRKSPAAEGAVIGDELGEMSDEDRRVIESSFADHVAAARRQVTEYADVLAGEDPVLRSRLRRFEDGGLS